jgi:phenylpropionate dioxygenase-like ring-hydroxylating dioxygenase large terminal subunit
VTRSPGPSYTDVLRTDTHAVPAHLFEESPGAFADSHVDVSRYTTRAFHDLERRAVWWRTWQFACRDEHVPQPGDTHDYEICDLVVRIERTADGGLVASTVGDGRRSGRAAAVASWGGFVFVKPDPAGGSLVDHLGEIVDHFAPWHLDRRYVEGHVAKEYPCNWKVVQEAFMESLHVGATHPQQLVRLGDTNSRYDCYDTVNRSLHPSGIPSPTLSWAPTEQEMLDSMLDVRVDEDPPVRIPEGSTLRSFASTIGREALRPSIGDEADALSDAELIDAILYFVFPNFHPWAAYQRLVYRFRPLGDRHDRSLMEVFVLSPFVGERPPPAACQWLGEDDPWTDAAVIGTTGRILEQDSYNLPKVQRGLAALQRPTVTLARYQESRIRHVHALIDRAIDEVEPGRATLA